MLKSLLIAVSLAFPYLLQADDLNEQFNRVTLALELPAGVLKSICTVESSLNYRAVRLNDGGPGRHAIGLCQVHYATAEFMKIKTHCSRISKKCLLLDPVINMNVAGLYLKMQLKRYNGNIKKAISAYNAGTWTHKNQYYVTKVLREMPSIKNPGIPKGTSYDICDLNPKEYICGVGK